jgi:hypothetical protein
MLVWNTTRACQLESCNAILIEQGLPQSERIVFLNKTAKKKLEALLTAQTEQEKLLAV